MMTFPPVPRKALASRLALLVSEVAAVARRPAALTTGLATVALASMVATVGGAPATPTAAASAASAPKLLTREQLRDCMARRTQVRTDSEQVAAEKDKVDKDQTALQARLEELKQRAAAVDRKKQSDIDAYNAETAERNRDIGDIDARISALNDRAASLRRAQESYAQDCVNRPYDDRDRAALEKEH